MKIGGLQKLSLIDYPGKLSCTVFLFGCNFRCGFCHNPELVLPEKIKNEFSEEEVLNFLEKRRKYLDAVCITGGEPLINNDVDEFLEKIKKMGYFIKVDTNGTNPELLKRIIEKKLINFVAMDIKADKDNYGVICGVEADLNKIENSMKIISDSEIGYEFRTTVVNGYHDEMVLKKMAQWINNVCGKKPKKFVIQNFIPREGKLIDDKFEKISSFSEEELENIKKSVEEYFEEVKIRT